MCREGKIHQKKRHQIGEGGMSMRMVEMSHNPYDRITKINYMRRELMKDSKLSRFQSKPFDEWYGEVIDYLIDELNEETFVISFLGKKSDYDFLRIVSNRYPGVTVIQEEMLDRKNEDELIRNVLNRLEEGPIESLQVDENGFAYGRMTNSGRNTLVITHLDEEKTQMFKSLFDVPTTVKSDVPSVTPMEGEIEGEYVRFNHIRSIDVLAAWNMETDTPRKVIYFTDEETDDEMFEVIASKINVHSERMTSDLERIVLSHIKTVRSIRKNERAEIKVSLDDDETPKVIENKKGRLFSKFVTDYLKSDSDDENVGLKELNLNKEDETRTIYDEVLDERIIFDALRKYAFVELNIQLSDTFKSLVGRIKIAQRDIEEMIDNIENAPVFPSEDDLKKSQKETISARAIEKHLKEMLDVNRRVNSLDIFESRKMSVVHRYKKSLEDVRGLLEKTSEQRIFELMKCTDLEMQNLQLDVLTDIEYKIALLFQEKFQGQIKKYVSLVNSNHDIERPDYSLDSTWLSLFEVPEILIEKRKTNNGDVRATLIMKPALNAANWNLFALWSRPFENLITYEGPMKSIKEESFESYQEAVKRNVLETYEQAIDLVESLENDFERYLIRELRKAEDTVRLLESESSSSEARRQSNGRNLTKLKMQLEWLEEMEDELSSIIELRPKFSRKGEDEA